LGLMEAPAAFDALMDLSNSKDWKHRSGAINSLARLKGLSDADDRKIEQRVADVLRDPSEVVYVRKDAAYAAGNRKYYDLIPDLVACFSNAHYSVRYSAAEALRQMAREAPTAASDVPGRIASELKRGMPGLDPLGLVPAIYAAGELPADMKMDIAEAALGHKLSGETEVSVAIARLLKPINPEREADRKRIKSLIARLPQTWEVKSSFQ
ncbi:MAG TPA: HEAT repeat domain-containing protein, partial [bacterium]|nr:HEAT repeat domain-containing protein [bacterium]